MYLRGVKPPRDGKITYLGVSAERKRKINFSTTLRHGRISVDSMTGKGKVLPEKNYL